jgi:hypothetical protein
MIHNFVCTQSDDIVEWRHDLLDPFRVELEDTVQDRNLVLAEGFLALTMELKERPAGVCMSNLYFLIYNEMR